MDVADPKPDTVPSKPSGPTKYPHSISGRISPEQFVVADALRATMDPPTWSEVLRWLLSSQPSKAVIAERVRSAG